MTRLDRLLPRPMRSLALGLATLLGLGALVAHATAPVGRYRVTDTTVKDRRTGLIWERVVPAANLQISQANAGLTCEQVGVDGGHWRLPTVAELETLVDPTEVSPAIDPVAFPNAPSLNFWTSTPYVRFGGQIWAVNFADGSDGAHDLNQPLAVRCVRVDSVAP